MNSQKTSEKGRPEKRAGREGKTENDKNRTKSQEESSKKRKNPTWLDES